MFRGRPRQAAMAHRQIRVGDIYKICELSLQASIFPHMNHTFQQVRGSAIGNQSAQFLPTSQLATWNISGLHSHKYNYFSNTLTVSTPPDTLTTDLSFQTNHNIFMMACSNFSQTLFTSLQFYLNKNQTCHPLDAQSTLTLRHCHTFNQLALGNSNLTPQQRRSSTNFQQHTAAFAWQHDTAAATHNNKQKLMLSP